MVETISVADLERLGACQLQVAQFREAFDEADDGVAVTMANMLVAIDAKLHLDWVAQCAFTNRAGMFYNRVKELARGELVRVFDSALAGYEHSQTSEETGFPLDIIAAWHTCQRIIDRADDECNRVVAIAWVAAYEASAVENRKEDK